MSFGGAREDETRSRLCQPLTLPTTRPTLTKTRPTLPKTRPTLPTTRLTLPTTILRITLLALLATLPTTPLANMAKRTSVVDMSSQPLSRDTSLQHQRIVLCDGQLRRHGFKKEVRRAWAERARRWRKKHFKLRQTLQKTTRVRVIGQRVREGESISALGQALQKTTHVREGESISARLDELAGYGIKASKCLCGNCDTGIDCLGYPCWPSCRHYERDLKSW